MLLREYFRKFRIEPPAFADDLGVSEAAVKKWVRGERTPRPNAMAKIAHATNGRVTANDFLPELRKEKAS